MATDPVTAGHRHLSALEQHNWTELVPAIDEAAGWLGTQPLGASDTDAVAAALARLSSHPKWEVRRAVAIAAGNVRHGALGNVLPRLLADPNARVQQPAEASSLKRREWRASGALGREHASRVNRALGDIGERYGARGRAAVQRAAAEMVSTFSRELYHEVVRHITPLQREIARLRKSIEGGEPAAVLATHAEVLQRDVNQIMSVLRIMRAYAATSEASFTEELLHEVIDESVRTVSDLAERFGVRIESQCGKELVVEIARVRLVQALSNLLHNALEAYDGLDRHDPILIEASGSGELIRLSIRDRGCGMSADRARDARALFATQKAHGSGIGLPLAIKIVDSEHDGELTIASVDGEGTTITITLPRFQRSQ
jgi:signal transduction histidine kinase